MADEPIVEDVTPSAIAPENNKKPESGLAGADGTKPSTGDGSVAGSDGTKPSTGDGSVAGADGTKPTVDEKKPEVYGLGEAKGPMDKLANPSTMMGGLLGALLGFLIGGPIGGLLGFLLGGMGGNMFSGNSLLDDVSKPVEVMAEKIPPARAQVREGDRTAPITTLDIKMEDGSRVVATGKADGDDFKVTSYQIVKDGKTTNHSANPPIIIGIDANGTVEVDAIAQEVQQRESAIAADKAKKPERGGKPEQSKTKGEPTADLGAAAGAAAGMAANRSLGRGQAHNAQEKGRANKGDAQGGSSRNSGTPHSPAEASAEVDPIVSITKIVKVKEGGFKTPTFDVVAVTESGNTRKLTLNTSIYNNKHDNTSGFKVNKITDENNEHIIPKNFIVTETLGGYGPVRMDSHSLQENLMRSEEDSILRQLNDAYFPKKPSKQKIIPRPEPEEEPSPASEAKSAPEEKPGNLRVVGANAPSTTGKYTVTFIDADGKKATLEGDEVKVDPSTKLKFVTLKTQISGSEEDGFEFKKIPEGIRFKVDDIDGSKFNNLTKQLEVQTDRLGTAKVIETGKTTANENQTIDQNNIKLSPSVPKIIQNDGNMLS